MLFLLVTPLGPALAVVAVVSGLVRRPGLVLAPADARLVRRQNVAVVVTASVGGLVSVVALVVVGMLPPQLSGPGKVVQEWEVPAIATLYLSLIAAAGLGRRGGDGPKTPVRHLAVRWTLVPPLVCGVLVAVCSLAFRLGCRPAGHLPGAPSGFLCGPHHDVFPPPVPWRALLPVAVGLAVSLWAGWRARQSPSPARWVGHRAAVAGSSFVSASLLALWAGGKLNDFVLLGIQADPFRKDWWVVAATAAVASAIGIVAAGRLLMPPLVSVEIRDLQRV